jgi:hypothetical protein
MDFQMPLLSHLTMLSPLTPCCSGLKFPILTPIVWVTSTYCLLWQILIGVEDVFEHATLTYENNAICDRNETFCFASFRFLKKILYFYFSFKKNYHIFLALNDFSFISSS